MKIGLNEPRRHHYVPRVYLQNFAIQHQNEWKVMVKDKVKNEQYSTNIKNVAVEKDFYRTNSKEDEFYWEHYYAEQIETLISSAFGRLITACTLSVDKSCVIDNELKLKFAKIICSQLLRTKKAREMQFEIGQRTAENVLRTVRKELEGLLSDEQVNYLDNFKYDEMMNKGITLPIINENDRINRFIDYLLRRYWVVYKNANYKINPLITSDHPVIFYNTVTRETDFSSNGLGVPQTVIFFPINPELIIGLYAQEVYFNIMAELNNKMIIVDEIPFVMKLNRIQYEQCYRQTYSTFK